MRQMGRIYLDQPERDLPTSTNYKMVTSNFLKGHSSHSCGASKGMHSFIKFSVFSMIFNAQEMQSALCS